MAALDLISGNQLQSLTGREQRPILGDVLAAAAPSVYRDQAFKQQQQQLQLEEESQALQRQAQTRQEQAQRDLASAQSRAQTQQVIGTAISGVGQGAALAEKVSPGILKSLLPGASTATEEAAPALVGYGGAAAGEASTVGGGAVASELAAQGVATETGGALATQAGGLAAGEAGGALAGAAVPGGVAGIAGGIAGHFVKQAAGGGVKGGLAGSAAGAAVGALGGFVAGGPIGALIGGLFGGLSGGLCIIHEASFGEHSREVAIARRFRDERLSRTQLRGYYALYEPVAARMHQDAPYRAYVRQELVERLVRYGAAELGMPYDRPTGKDVRVARQFLAHIEQAGRGIDSFTRANGEVV